MGLDCRRDMYMRVLVAMLQVEASKVTESVTSISTTREETEELEATIKQEVERAK